MGLRLAKSRLKAVARSACHYIHFFAHPAAADKWTATHASTFILSLVEGSEVARLVNPDATPACDRESVAGCGAGYDSGARRALPVRGKGKAHLNLAVLLVGVSFPALIADSGPW